VIGLATPVHDAPELRVSGLSFAVACHSDEYAYTVYVVSVCPPKSAGAENDTMVAEPAGWLAALTAVGTVGTAPGATPPNTSFAPYHVLPVTATHCADVRFIGESGPAVTLFTQLPPHSEWGPVPKLLVAVTVKRYHTPFVRPGTMTALRSIEHRVAVHVSGSSAGESGMVVADNPPDPTVYTPAHSHSSLEPVFVDSTTVSPVA